LKYTILYEKKILTGSLTAEVGPIFGRKLQVCFTFFLWSTFEKQVCVF